MHSTGMKEVQDKVPIGGKTTWRRLVDFNVVDFTVEADYRLKIKENGKINKHLEHEKEVNAVAH